MVQTLAALLSWIAMLAIISIAVLVSGVWRPRSVLASAPDGLLDPLDLGQARARAEALAQSRARSDAARRQRRAA